MLKNRSFYQTGRWQKAPLSYAAAAIGVGFTTLTIYWLHADESVANVSMLYLLIVTGAALWLGRGPAIFSSVVSFLAFDWFFVNPKYQFTVQQPSEWLALFTFLFTAIVIGQLMALLQHEAEEERRRSKEIMALAEASWAVASELDRDRALIQVLRQLALLDEVDQVGLFVMDKSGQISLIGEQSSLVSNGDGSVNVFDEEAVRFVFESRKTIGWDESSHWSHALAGTKWPNAAYLPIVFEDHVLGVLALCLKYNRPLSESARHVIDSLSNHAATVFQKDKFMRAEAQAQALIEADRLKTALLSMVSHDFRSPLTSIKANVSSLLEDEPPWEADARRQVLQSIEQETDRLNAIVGNILDLSRLEAGAWRPRREMSPLAELVGAALDAFDKVKNARIQVNIQNGLNEVFVDSVQIVQVLINLLQNALKYSPATAEVELDALSSDGSDLILKVSDRGSGLPKGEEGKIFEPFFRAQAHQESSVPGVGIGLAVCRGLIEAHGGTIAATNREGGGTVFCVTLLLANVRHDESKENESTCN